MKRIVLMIFGIIFTTSFAFSQGNLEATINVQNNHCYGFCEGEIQIIVNGGVQPYTYLWSNGETGYKIDSLCGNYNFTVTVTDAVGDTLQKSANIFTPPAIEVLSEDQIVCCFDLATLSPGVTGGTLPYLYYWNYVQSNPSILVTTCITTLYHFFVIDANDCKSDTIHVALFVENYPPIAHIDIVNSELNSNSYCGNQWYSDTDSVPDFKNKGLTSTLIPGANEQQYTPTETGYYFDIITDNIGNESISNVVYFTYNNNDIIGNDKALLVYPNPTKDFINIDLSKINEKTYKVMICNIYGQLIDEYDFKNEGVNKISVNKLKSGLYVIKVKTNQGEINRKVMINE
ncbi:MAG: hypothetical protein CVU05_13935 [Bacteroidetes bacterium HGW-Bacteroidetes-21]|nr:MAG: hypothetical protein CVU05_13935 [Bacteroidetes bacterium HGW-Bacteroidetes-21]